MSKSVLSKIKITALLMMLLFLCASCKKDEKKARYEVSYTVCDATKLPNQLLSIIEEKKKNSFKISYIDNSYMYIAVGYGEKNRSNFHVAVEDLYVTDRELYISTNLYTDKATMSDATTNEGSMYPYIVIKCEKYDLPVIFDTN